MADTINLMEVLHESGKDVNYDSKEFGIIFAIILRSAQSKFGCERCCYFTKESFARNIKKFKAMGGLAGGWVIGDPIDGSAYWANLILPTLKPHVSLLMTPLVAYVDKNSF